jgi:hypothetical protein
MTRHIASYTRNTASLAGSEAEAKGSPPASRVIGQQIETALGPIGWSRSGPPTQWSQGHRHRSGGEERARRLHPPVRLYLT